MLNSTLYADKETQLSMDQQDNSFCLKLNKSLDYDLSIVGRREVFEKIYEVLEQNLYDEDTNNELYEKLVEKELLLEQAQSQIQSLEDRIEFLQRG
jgi:translation initiation factor 2B subunit (eIF-2B alpha/beta/delta family)